MTKVKLTFFDRIFKGDRYDNIFRIVQLREQCQSISTAWNSVSILTQLSSYRQVNYDMHKFSMFTLDESRMMSDLGPEAVIERLTNDRDKMLNILKDVKEIDLSDLHRQIREEKLNNILQ
jgi:hypothetical protein